MGDLTGNVTGDVTGDVTSSGTSSFADVDASGTVTATTFIGALTGDVTSSGTSSFGDCGVSGALTANSAVITTTLDVGGAVNFGANNLYPLGSTADGYVVYCGVTSGFTETVTIPVGTHGVTTPTVAIATQQTTPAATAAHLTTAISTDNVVLNSWNSTYGAGTTEIVGYYCVYGLK